MANRDLIPWARSGLSPFGRDPFASFRREMDRLFDDFFAPAETRSFAAPAQAAMISPSIDVHEDEQAYIVSAELPGIEQKDIELNLRDNVLTVCGEKRSEHKEEEAGRRYAERSYGRFERTIPFPAEIDADHVEASCQNGVLKIRLPKSTRAQEKARRIEIKGDGAQAGQSQGGAKASAGQTSSAQPSSAQASGAQGASQQSPGSGS